MLFPTFLGALLCSFLLPWAKSSPPPFRVGFMLLSVREPAHQEDEGILVNGTVPLSENPNPQITLINAAA